MMPRFVIEANAPARLTATAPESVSGSLFPLTLVPALGMLSRVLRSPGQARGRSATQRTGCADADRIDTDTITDEGGGLGWTKR